MVVAELDADDVRRRPGQVVVAADGVVDETEIGPGVGESAAHPIAVGDEVARQRRVEPELDAAVSRLADVAIGRHGERRLGKGADVLVDDLVVDLDLVDGCLPREPARKLATCSQLGLPGVLRFEVEETRSAEARELEDERRLDGAAHVRERFDVASGGAPQETELRREGAVGALVGAIAVGEEAVVVGALRLVPADSGDEEQARHEPGFALQIGAEVHGFGAELADERTALAAEIGVAALVVVSPLRRDTDHQPLEAGAGTAFEGVAQLAAPGLLILLEDLEDGMNDVAGLAEDGGFDAALAQPTAEAEAHPPIVVDPAGIEEEVPRARLPRIALHLFPGQRAGKLFVDVGVDRVGPDLEVLVELPVQIAEKASALLLGVLAEALKVGPRGAEEVAAARTDSSRSAGHRFDEAVRTAGELRHERLSGRPGVGDEVERSAEGIAAVAQRVRCPSRAPPVRSPECRAFRNRRSRRRPDTAHR